MALDWSTVKPLHVADACETLLKSSSISKTRGLFVKFNGQPLPAKVVARLAYARANNLAPESVPKFASGESLLKLLERLGFAVERHRGTPN
jgi:hypothetical protein